MLDPTLEAHAVLTVAEYQALQVVPLSYHDTLPPSATTTPSYTPTSSPLHLILLSLLGSSFSEPGAGSVLSPPQSLHLLQIY